MKGAFLSYSSSLEIHPVATAQRRVGGGWGACYGTQPYFHSIPPPPNMSPWRPSFILHIWVHKDLENSRQDSNIACKIGKAFPLEIPLGVSMSQVEPTPTQTTGHFTSTYDRLSRRQHLHGLRVNLRTPMTSRAEGSTLAKCRSRKKPYRTETSCKNKEKRRKKKLDTTEQLRM